MYSVPKLYLLWVYPSPAAHLSAAQDLVHLPHHPAQKKHTDPQLAKAALQAKHEATNSFCTICGVYADVYTSKVRLSMSLNVNSWLHIDLLTCAQHSGLASGTMFSATARHLSYRHHRHKQMAVPDLSTLHCGLSHYTKVSRLLGSLHLSWLLQLCPFSACQAEPQLLLAA